MFYVKRLGNGALVEVDQANSVIIDKAEYSFATVASWPDDLLAAANIFRVPEAEAPAGREILGYSFAKVDGQIVQQLELAAPVPPTRIRRATVRRRMTTEELEAYRSYLENARAEDWSYYNDTMVFSIADQEFPKFREGMMDAFAANLPEPPAQGVEARVMEILEPEL